MNFDFLDLLKLRLLATLALLDDIVDITDITKEKYEDETIRNIKMLGMMLKKQRLIEDLLLDEDFVKELRMRRGENFEELLERWIAKHLLSQM